MIARPLISNRYPYIPVIVTVAGYRVAVEAFLDTGFEGNLLVPTGLLPMNIPPHSNTIWTMADGRRVVALL